MEQKFLEDLEALSSNKNYNSIELTRSDCQEIIQRLNELQVPGEKREKKDYRLLNKYEVKKIDVEGHSIETLQKKGRSNSNFKSVI